MTKYRHQAPGWTQRKKEKPQQRRLSGAGRPSEELKRMGVDASSYVAQNLRPTTIAQTQLCKADHEAVGSDNSVVVHQPLDVVELELRAEVLAEAAPQLLQNAARALNVDFARHLYSGIIAIVATAQRTAERVRFLLRA